MKDKLSRVKEENMTQKNSLEAAIEWAEAALIKPAYPMSALIGTNHLVMLIEAAKAHLKEISKCSHIFMIQENDLVCLGCKERINSEPSKVQGFLSTLDPDKIHLVLYDEAHAASLREPLGNEGWMESEDIADKVLNMTDEQIRAVLILEKRCPNCAANETKATIIQALYDHVKKDKHCFVHCGERCDCEAGNPSPPSTKPEEKE